ncbi:MAG: hypothetical protein QXF01_02325 [Candidatus Micrarchaeaceae archaeon]
MKTVYDIRGKQKNIFRLAGFDLEGLIHMVAYRILIFASFIIGIIVLGTILFAPGALGSSYINVLILLVWVLMAPQVYETAKAFAIIVSKDLSSEYLNQSFVNSSARNKSSYAAYRVFPYVMLAVWIIGFAIMLAMWFA